MASDTPWSTSGHVPPVGQPGGGGASVADDARHCPPCPDGGRAATWTAWIPLLLTLSSDQEFLRDTTAKFLADQAPVGRDPPAARRPRGIRRRVLAARRRTGMDLPAGQRGARRRIDQRRRARRPHPDRPRVRRATPHRAPGPHQRRRRRPSADPSGRHADLLAGLLAGTSVASWCFGEPPAGRPPRGPRPRGPGRGLRRGPRRHQATGRVGRPGHPPAGHRAHRRRAHPGARARPTPPA